MWIRRLNRGKIQLAILQILLLISVVVYLDLSFIRDNYEIYEAVLFFTVSIASLVSIILVKSNFTFNRFEYCFAAFALYSIIRVFCLQNPDIATVANIIFPVFIYYALRNLFNTIRTEKIIISIAYALLTLFILYILVYFTSESIRYIFIPNASVFAILLSGQLSFLIQTPHRNYLLILPAVVILILTDGRSGWLGLLISFLWYCKRKIKIAGIILLLLALPILVTYKSSSSSGRMLIYKVSVQALKDNFLFGVGAGQFSKEYNEYQGKYFQSNGIDSDEAILADNSTYVFNDLLQLFVENGVIGFLLFMGSLIFLIKHFSKSPHCSALICVSVSALMFYPFHIFPICFFSCICLSLIKKSYTGKQVFKFAFVIIGSFLTIHFWMNVQYKIRAHRANELAQSGFKSKAIFEYEKVSQSYIKDGKIMLRYAKELYNINELQKAYNILQKLKLYYPTHEVFRISGEVSMQLQLHKQAEDDFLNSIYRVPNRMTSRYELFKYYLLVKDTFNARYWGYSILNMPVKVTSVKTRDMQEKVANLLESING